MADKLSQLLAAIPAPPQPDTPQGVEPALADFVGVGTAPTDLTAPLQYDSGFDSRARALRKFAQAHQGDQAKFDQFKRQLALVTAAGVIGDPGKFATMPTAQRDDRVAIAEAILSAEKSILRKDMAIGALRGFDRTMTLGAGTTLATAMEGRPIRPETGWGQAAEIGAELATYAIPISAGRKVLDGVQGLSRFGGQWFRPDIAATELGALGASLAPGMVAERVLGDKQSVGAAAYDVAKETTGGSILFGLGMSALSRAASAAARAYSRSQILKATRHTDRVEIPSELMTSSLVEKMEALGFRRPMEQPNLFFRPTGKTAAGAEINPVEFDIVRGPATKPDIKLVSGGTIERMTGRPGMTFDQRFELVRQGYTAVPDPLNPGKWAMVRQKGARTPAQEVALDDVNDVFTFLDMPAAPSKESTAAIRSHLRNITGQQPKTGEEMALKQWAVESAPLLRPLEQAARQRGFNVAEVVFDPEAPHTLILQASAPDSQVGRALTRQGWDRITVRLGPSKPSTPASALPGGPVIDLHTPNLDLWRGTDVAIRQMQHGIDDAMRAIGLPPEVNALHHLLARVKHARDSFDLAHSARVEAQQTKELAGSATVRNRLFVEKNLADFLDTLQQQTAKFAEQYKIPVPKWAPIVTERTGEIPASFAAGVRGAGQMPSRIAQMLLSKDEQLMLPNAGPSANKIGKQWQKFEGVLKDRYPAVVEHLKTIFVDPTTGALRTNESLNRIGAALRAKLDPNHPAVKILSQDEGVAAAELGAMQHAEVSHLARLGGQSRTRSGKYQPIQSLGDDLAYFLHDQALDSFARTKGPWFERAMDELTSPHRGYTEAEALDIILDYAGAGRFRAAGDNILPETLLHRSNAQLFPPDFYDDNAYHAATRFFHKLETEIALVEAFGPPKTRDADLRRLFNSALVEQSPSPRRASAGDTTAAVDAYLKSQQKSMKTYFGTQPSTAAAEALLNWRTAMAVAKLPLNLSLYALQITQAAIGGSRFGILRGIRAGLELLARPAEREAIRASGALTLGPDLFLALEHTARPVSEGIRHTAARMMKGQWFSDNVARAWNANIFRSYFEDAMRLLADVPPNMRSGLARNKTEVQAMLKDMGVQDEFVTRILDRYRAGVDKTPTLAPEEYRRVVQLGAGKLTLEPNAKNLPTWIATNSLMKTIFQFRSFGLLQARDNFVRGVLAPAARGNPGPLIRMAAVSGMTGDLINDLRGWIRGTGRLEQTLAHRILNDFLVMGTAGVFELMLDPINGLLGTNPERVISRSTLGPTGQSLANVLQAVTGYARGRIPLDYAAARVVSNLIPLGADLEFSVRQGALARGLGRGDQADYFQYTQAAKVVAQHALRGQPLFPPRQPQQDETAGLWEAARRQDLDAFKFFYRRYMKDLRQTERSFPGMLAIVRGHHPLRVAAKIPKTWRPQFDAQFGKRLAGATQHYKDVAATFMVYARETLKADPPKNYGVLAPSTFHPLLDVSEFRNTE